MSKQHQRGSLAGLFARAEKHPEYWIAGLEIEFTEELCRVMEEQGVSRAELARRVGTSAAYITKILRGTTNFSLATMAKLARALGMELRISLAHRSFPAAVSSAGRRSQPLSPMPAHRDAGGGIPTAGGEA